MVPTLNAIFHTNMTRGSLRASKTSIDRDKTETRVETILDLFGRHVTSHSPSFIQKTWYRMMIIFKVQY